MRAALSGLKNRALGPGSAAAEACLTALGLERPAALLLLGHMRSGSTLLLHLLLTNPEIAALGERNRRYASAADLARLALAARWARERPLRRLRYVADQINHNHLTPNAKLFQNPRVRLVFLLREPQSALASLLELSRTFYDHAWSVAKAVEYYVARLQAFRDVGATIGAPGRAALVRYESLIAQPAQSLEALRLFLGLTESFSVTYPLQPFTQERGDPGSKIASGVIVSPGAAVPAVDFKTEELQRVRAAYDGCRAALARFALEPS